MSVIGVMPWIWSTSYTLFSRFSNVPSLLMRFSFSLTPISLPQSAQVTTNQPRPVLGLVPLCLTACMKRLREVLRQIGRRADLSSVRILPSVIPVTSVYFSTFHTLVRPIRLPYFKQKYFYHVQTLCLHCRASRSSLLYQ
jgi:hypothetical protein